MAFPQVGSTALSSRSTNALDDVITMPSSIVAGDLLIVVHASDTTSGTRTWSGSFVEIKDLAATSSVGVAYKIAVGGDTLTVTKTVSERFSAIALRITAASWHGTTPPEISTTATGTSTTPNPDSITASWGSADNLFIAFHVHDTDATNRTVDVWPTNYTANQIQGDYFSSSGEPNLATRELAASNDDPATFTISASLGWRAGTIVIRPNLGQTITVGQVTETDISQTIAWAPKRRLVGQIVEIDLSQSVVWAPKNRLIGQILETGLAQTIGRVKSRTLGQIVETNVAFVVVRKVGLTVMVGQVLETDLSQVIKWAPKIRLLEFTSEFDLAFSIAKLKRKLLIQSLEADLAMDISSGVAFITIIDLALGSDYTSRQAAPKLLIKKSSAGIGEVNEIVEIGDNAYIIRKKE